MNSGQNVIRVSISALLNQAMGGHVLSPEAADDLRKQLVGVKVYRGFGEPDAPRSLTDLVGEVVGVEGDTALIRLGETPPYSLVAQIGALGRLGDGEQASTIVEIHHVVDVALMVDMPQAAKAS